MKPILHDLEPAVRVNGAHDADKPALALNLPINPGKVARVLAAIAVCLALLSIVGKYVEDAAGGEDAILILSNLVRLFNVNRELSIPAWFSAAMLLSCAATLAVIALAKREDRYARHWVGLAIIFLYLSIDEASAIHEKFTEPLQIWLEPTGVLFFAWVIIGAPLVVIFALFYLRFLLHLPPHIRILVALAGVTYVGGAIIVEGISASQWYLDGGSSLFYSAIGTVEELFEMFGVILFLYALLAYVERVQVGVQLQPQSTVGAPSLSGVITRLEQSRPLLNRAALSPALIVFFGGMNLILVQWVLVRELTTLLLGTELVVLLVSVAYFAGLSLGYLLAGRIRRQWLPALGVVTLALHLTLPVWFRLLVAALDSMGAYWAAYLVLPILTPFVVSAFYSVFLPLFVDSGEGDLPRLYALELAGSALGVLALVMLGGLGLPTVYVAYSAGLLLILWALGLRRVLVGALAVVTGAWLAALPGAHFWSNALWYEQVQGLPEGTTTLFSGYSPYQKVDVLESPGGARYLFLDGLEHFGGVDGSRLNVVAGQIPASIVWPRSALVLGAGSMEMEALIADYAGHVTTVEIDPLVVDASVRYFTSVNRMDMLTNRNIVMDDAKHFLANTDAEYDLIATDLPAAYSLQTATLYSQPFFQTVHSHLAPDGVFVVNLTSTFGADDLVSRRIAAGLLMTFDDVIVVTAESVGWSFAYASDNLPFNTAVIESALQQSGEARYAIFDTPAVRAFVGEAPPITLDSMDIVLHVSAGYIGGRLR